MGLVRCTLRPPNPPRSTGAIVRTVVLLKGGIPRLDYEVALGRDFLLPDLLVNQIMNVRIVLSNLSVIIVKFGRIQS